MHLLITYLEKAYSIYIWFNYHGYTSDDFELAEYIRCVIPVTIVEYLKPHLDANISKLIATTFKKPKYETNLNCDLKDPIQIINSIPVIKALFFALEQSGLVNKQTAHEINIYLQLYLDQLKNQYPVITPVSTRKLTRAKFVATNLALTRHKKPPLEEEIEENNEIPKHSESTLANLGRFIRRFVCATIWILGFALLATIAIGAIACALSNPFTLAMTTAVIGTSVAISPWAYLATGLIFAGLSLLEATLGLRSFGFCQCKSRSRTNLAPHEMELENIGNSDNDDDVNELLKGDDYDLTADSPLHNVTASTLNNDFNYYNQGPFAQRPKSRSCFLGLFNCGKLNGSVSYASVSPDDSYRFTDI